MKNIFKYSAAVALMVLGFASCEEMPDYQTTIDAAPDFIYVNPQGGDIFSAVVVHRPEGSAGSYTAEFQVKYNTTKHEEVTASVVYAPDLVAEYNLKNGIVDDIVGGKERDKGYYVDSAFQSRRTRDKEKYRLDF